MEFTRSELEDQTRRQERDSLLLSIICDCGSVVFVMAFVIMVIWSFPWMRLHFSLHSHRTSIRPCVTFENVARIEIKFTLHVCNVLFILWIEFECIENVLSMFNL